MLWKFGQFQLFNFSAELRPMMDDDLANAVKNININQKNLNVLLLGETGVGKSTFINSLVNYLHFNDFDEAEKNNLEILIPSKFTMFDKNSEKHVVEIGKGIDKNEFLETGASATQDVKTYLFNTRDGKTIRLIDTPGMGDTRGIDYDNDNCENILSYIGKIHQLHAICFLFKPQTTRVTSFFSYCMAQIFSRLDKSAAKNIIFVFTNTRGTNYFPGDTYTILQDMVNAKKEQSPYIDISLNMFCFDNEGFRFLAAKREGISFDNSYRRDVKGSWERSASECWRLIFYINSLKPHHVGSTSAVNEARRMIYQLAQPLAQISELINDNIAALERHQAQLNLNHQSLHELKKNLYIPCVNLTVINLDKPVTVCADHKCAEVYKVGTKNKYHYKQRCHDPCFLKKVPKEIIGSPELAHCAAINKKTQLCEKCSCHFSVHMHVYYMTNTFEDKLIDETILKNIDNKENALNKAKQCIVDMENRKIGFEQELKAITTCAAKFAHFLQHNAITPFSDSYIDYIIHLLIREKSLGENANDDTIRHLEAMLNEYREIKKTFDEAQSNERSTDSNAMLITPTEIHESIQELYKLKHCGKKIQQLYQSQKTARKKEHLNTEYVHKTSFVTPTRKKSVNPIQQNKKSNDNHGQQSKYRPPNNSTRQKYNTPRRSHGPPPSYESSAPIHQLPLGDPTYRGGPYYSHAAPHPPNYPPPLMYLPHSSNQYPACDDRHSHGNPKHVRNTHQSDRNRGHSGKRSPTFQVNVTIPTKGEHQQPPIPPSAPRDNNYHLRGYGYPPYPHPSYYPDDPHYHHHPDYYPGDPHYHQHPYGVQHAPLTKNVRGNPSTRPSSGGRGKNISSARHNQREGRGGVSKNYKKKNQPNTNNDNGFVSDSSDF